MHDVFIDEYSLAWMQRNDGFQRHNFNFPWQHIDKLQILVPVHDLKAGISRITVVVYDIEYQVWKVCVLVQVDGIDIVLLFHYASSNWRDFNIFWIDSNSIAQ